MNSVPSLAIVALLAALSPESSAQTLTSLPGGCNGAGHMSSNADYVVGYAGLNGGYLWSHQTGGVVFLGGKDAVAVSDDGQFVLGNIANAQGENEAALWHSLSGAWSGLGTIPGGSACGSLTTGIDMSNDGGVATGLAWQACQGRAFAYTIAGMDKVPQFGLNSSRGNAVSGNGQYVGGWIQADNGVRRAAVWNLAAGTQLLPLVTQTDFLGAGEVWGFSANGRYVVGQAQQLWIYDQLEHTLTLLGTLPNPAPTDIVVARAISDDGKTIVGRVGSGFGPWRAFIWTELDGMHDLETYLNSLGISPPFPLYGAFDVSADGRTILGAYSQGIGANDAFVFDLPSIDNLGGSTPGTGGQHPVLSANGTLAPGSLFALYLEDGKPGASATLVVSNQANPVPLFTGTFFPVPVVVMIPGLTLNAQGDITIATSWPQNLPSGLTIAVQALVPDSAAFANYALSNGLLITTP